MKITNKFAKISKVFLVSLLITVSTFLGTAQGSSKVLPKTTWEVNIIPHQVQIYYRTMDTWVSYSYIRIPCDTTSIHFGTKIFRVGNDCYLGDLNTALFVKLSGETMWTPVMKKTYRGER